MANRSSPARHSSLIQRTAPRRVSSRRPPAEERVVGLLYRWKRLLVAATPGFLVQYPVNLIEKHGLIAGNSHVRLNKGAPEVQFGLRGLQRRAAD